MQERASRRALLVVGILLVVLLVVADLARRDSIIRSGWRDLTQRETPLERLLQPIRRHDVSSAGRGDVTPLPGRGVPRAV